jgi:hypothetical protein
MADERSAATMIQEIEFAPDSPLARWRERIRTCMGLFLSSGCFGFC